MAHRILILDDDEDFNNLLTDIFSQSSYDVTSLRDPEEALEVYRSTPFDLIVTDQKMPGMSGEEFIRAVKRLDPDVPVIMVSGYLDNDTIRDLIREGVGGVFLKPLNVFSLLKRTAALLEEVKHSVRRDGVSGGDADTSVDFQHNLPFTFTSFPAKSARAAEFANKLYSLRNFRSNLVLIGEEGTDFKGVCRDLEGFDETASDRFIFLSADSYTPAVISEALDSCSEDGIKRVTLVILNIGELTDDAKKLVFAVVRKEGEFAEYSIPARLVFCLNEDIDTLYDRGSIDDDLYMLLGTTEIRIPALRECEEDLPILAQRIINDLAVGARIQPIPRLDPELRGWIRDNRWPGNFQEMYRLLRKILKSGGEESLGLADLPKDTMGNGASVGSDGIETMVERFRDEYIRAVFVLCGDDIGRAAKVLELEPRIVERCLDLEVQR